MSESTPKETAPQQNQEAKPWWQSRTIWWNIVTALLFILTATMADAQKLMNPTTFSIYSAIVTAVNLILRSDTKTPITFKRNLQHKGG